VFAVDYYICVTHGLQAGAGEPDSGYKLSCMAYIIGVDIGTSGTTAVAIDMAGRVLAEYRITYPILNPQPHHFEQDPEVLFNAVIQAIGQTVGRVKRQAGSACLSGVGFSSAMHGLIAMDKD